VGGGDQARLHVAPGHTQQVLLPRPLLNGVEVGGCVVVDSLLRLRVLLINDRLDLLVGLVDLGIVQHSNLVNELFLLVVVAPFPHGGLSPGHSVFSLHHQRPVELGEGVELGEDVLVEAFDLVESVFVPPVLHAPEALVEAVHVVAILDLGEVLVEPFHLLPVLGLPQGALPAHRPLHIPIERPVNDAPALLLVEPPTQMIR